MKTVPLLCGTLASLALAAPTKPNVWKRYGPDHPPYPYSVPEAPSPTGGMIPSGVPWPSGAPMPSEAPCPDSTTPQPTGFQPPPYPYPYPYPHHPHPQPTGTAPSISISTSTSTSTSISTSSASPSCSPNGELLCNGPSQFGLCNWGQVVWQNVSLGTACIDGQIVGVGIYGEGREET